MDKKLPARPNLEQLRSQAKTLLTRLNEGDQDAAQTFIEHLPSAAKLSPEEVKNRGFRLADAQSAIARKTGFASWPGLAHHVQQLRDMEGTWEFVDLEIDGMEVPATALGQSQLLIDGDRFRMESPEATYEGIFTIDVEQTPHHIDIEFVEGPEAGNWSYGLFQVEKDSFKICLGLTGSTRPEDFKTSPGSGHALENLRRVSKDRPERVEGGTPPPKQEEQADPASFETTITPLLEQLQGEWAAIQVVIDGKELPAQMLSMGERTMFGNETKVVFGGQTMVHAKVRIDETTTPISIDYLNLPKNTLTKGIMDWVGEEARFCMAPPGGERPQDFNSPKGSGRTLSRWKKK